MKILLVVHCFFPDHFYGTEAYTLTLAKNLQMLGHQVVVFSAFFPGEWPNKKLLTFYDFQSIPVIAVNRDHLRSNNLQTSYDLPALEPVFTEIIQQERPDVVHINHLMNHTVALARVVKKFSLPIVATLTDFYAFCFNARLENSKGQFCPGPNKRASNCLACLRRDAHNYPWAAGLSTSRSGSKEILRRMLAHLSPPDPGLAEVQRGLHQRAQALLATYSAFDAVITPTNFIEKQFRRLAPDLKYHRLNFGVDVDRSCKPSRSSGDPLTVGFIGQLTAHKGPDILIEAIRYLPQKCNLRIQLYGSENQDPAFARQLRSASSGLPVDYLGIFSPDAIAKVMRNIDVLVIPSRWHENSPLVLLYALATHTPVIVSEAEGMTEFIRYGENGFVFPMGNASKLSVILKRFLTQPSLAACLSSQTSYDLTGAAMALEIIELYRNVRSLQVAKCRNT